MASTSYPVGHALAVQLWARKLAVEALRQTYFYDFMGRGADQLVQYRDELGKNAGDRVTFGLRGQLTGAGIQGDGTLEGNEEALSTYADTLIIDQLRHAVRSSGKMSEQRVPFSVREEAKDGLRDWWADRLDTAMFNQLCGFTAQTDTRYTGNNATIAPDSSHIYRPSGTDDQSLTTGDEFDLAIIDTMVARANQFSTANSSGVPMKPLRGPNGRKMWVMFLHDNQVYQLRQSSTAAGSWVDYERAKVQGGNMDSPIYKGGDLVGEYNGVVLHRAPRVTNGVHSTTGAAVANVRRAVLCGAQAAMFATGRDEDVAEQGKFSWVEESFDYGNQLGVSAGSIFGLKKTRFNSKDFACFVASTYSPNP